MKSKLIDSNNIMIITGTRKGIGRDLALYYIENGYKVIGCSRGKSSIIHYNYDHHELDITDETSVKSFFSEIRKKYGKVHVLINNAAVNNALSPITLVSFKSASSTINTNFLGTFIMSREAIKLMINNRFGRIINFGSMAVKHEEKGEAIYTASKAAIISFTKILSKEIYQYGITCNIVSPSALKTDLMQNINSELLNIILKRNAINELASNEEIINVVNWLISLEANKITGQNIYLGGV